MEQQLIQAVRAHSLADVQALTQAGASPSARDAESGLTALMLAACQADTAIALHLIQAGADVFAVDSRAGASALHKACQGGSIEIVRALVGAGAFVDQVAVTTGHTPLMDALWFKWPEIVGFLLDSGATLHLSTHYGFSLLEHFQYELNVTVIGKERLFQADALLKQRQQDDQQKIDRQQLMAAVVADDLAEVQRLLAAGAAVDERYPLVNSFNDGHTPLLVAARDGRTAIVAALLWAGADVNATEPTFGAVPLHKAVYNGHAEITRMLVRQPGVLLDFQGATNGYTPLHDSLWHGFDECATALVTAGARLDLRGHDGKMPLDLAREVFGPQHPIVSLIRAHVEPLVDIMV
ncbi:hypothetical protein F8S13_03755 [Chloroflexia bacterium SDU3-3]|nr:hypothetical protein F8S13_03755 [Chloroflexia bacterium SDU3-3]